MVTVAQTCIAIAIARVATILCQLLASTLTGRHWRLSCHQKYLCMCMGLKVINGLIQTLV